jgi:hypothetical protein
MIGVSGGNHGKRLGYLGGMEKLQAATLASLDWPSLGFRTVPEAKRATIAVRLISVSAFPGVTRGKMKIFGAVFAC